MENEEKVMTGEESMKIITDMINRTKVNFSQSSFHLILWGWIIIICAISEYLLSRLTDMKSPWIVWLLSIAGVIISMVYGYIKGKRSKVYTYSDKITMWTWIAFLITAIIMFILMRKQLENISPMIMMLAGFPTFISGISIRFMPMTLGGISLWIIALIAGFSGPEFGSPAIAIGMITGYLIPGYMLRRRNSHVTV